MIKKEEHYHLIKNLKIEENKNLQNILDFCEVVESEKQGVKFIKKMIVTLMEINNNEINKNVQKI